MKYLGLFLMMVIALTSSAQITVFNDNFESNNSKWIKTGTWGLTTVRKHNGSRSMTDSPGGNYLNNTNTSITMNNGVALDSCLDAELSFWAVYDIETGFDYCYVDVSSDNWSTYTRIATFNGENNLTPWTQYNYSLGGFIGKTNVKVRFLFYTDAGYVVDGIYIDDLKITKDTVDKSPPLIIHAAPEHYESTLGVQYLTADIIDTSGVGLAELTYTVDGGTPNTISGVHAFGDQYTFNIPAQTEGSWVDYYITAADTAAIPNQVVTDTFRYITGNHIYYDNGVVSFVNNFGPTGTGGDAIAVRVTFPGTTNLVTALLRNYTDVNNPNDSIDVHIWEDSSGVPGADMIAPIRMFPEATLLNTNVMTRVDLRPFSSVLTNITGSVFIGYTAPSGRAWISYTAGGSANRSFIETSGSWSQILGSDYHIRAVTGFMSGAPIAGFTVDTTNDPTLSFTDTTLNTPTAWYWEFGDGQIDSVQNPSHTYSENGSYQVCLTATNGFGSNKVCHIVNISKVAPVADFSVDLSLDPILSFNDLSRNNPTNWEWNFGDDGPLSNAQNPIHTFDSNKTYQVCLKAWNSIGTDSTCQTVNIQGYKLPVADFSFENTSVGVFQFSDSSTNNPSAWLWAFGNGESDSVQNPIHTYLKNQKFIVCLVASNGAGKSAPVCKEIEVKYIGVEGFSEEEGISIYPNPADDHIILKTDGIQEGHIIISDITGKELVRKEFNANDQSLINLDWLESGQYLIRVESDKTYFRKLIIE